MGKLKESIHNPYIYDTEQELPTWTDPVFIGKAMAMRNDNQHKSKPSPDWYEDMPDLMGEALAQAERDFLATTDLTEWEQLELDLWEGRHGINEQTAWDVAGGRVRG